MNNKRTIDILEKKNQRNFLFNKCLRFLFLKTIKQNLVQKHFNGSSLNDWFVWKKENKWEKNMKLPNVHSEIWREKKGECVSVFCILQINLSNNITIFFCILLQTISGVVSNEWLCVCLSCIEKTNIRYFTSLKSKSKSKVEASKQWAMMG